MTGEDGVPGVSDSAVRPTPYNPLTRLYAEVARRSRRFPTDGLAPDR